MPILNRYDSVQKIKGRVPKTVIIAAASAPPIRDRGSITRIETKIVAITEAKQLHFLVCLRWR